MLLAYFRHGKSLNNRSHTDYDIAQVYWDILHPTVMYWGIFVQIALGIRSGVVLTWCSASFMIKTFRPWLNHSEWVPSISSWYLWSAISFFSPDDDASGQGLCFSYWTPCLGCMPLVTLSCPGSGSEQGLFYVYSCVITLLLHTRCKRQAYLLVIASCWTKLSEKCFVFFFFDLFFNN